jgi:hypothetical protein
MIITNIIASKLGVKKDDKSTIVSDVFLASINSEQWVCGDKKPNFSERHHDIRPDCILIFPLD